MANDLLMLGLNNRTYVEMNLSVLYLHTTKWNHFKRTNSYATEHQQYRSICLNDFDAEGAMEVVRWMHGEDIRITEQNKINIINVACFMEIQPLIEMHLDVLIHYLNEISYKLRVNSNPRKSFRPAVTVCQPYDERMERLLRIFRENAGKMTIDQIKNINLNVIILLMSSRCLLERKMTSIFLMMDWIALVRPRMHIIYTILQSFTFTDVRCWDHFTDTRYNIHLFLTKFFWNSSRFLIYDDGTSEIEIPRRDPDPIPVYRYHHNEGGARTEYKPEEIKLHRITFYVYKERREGIDLPIKYLERGGPFPLEINRNLPIDQQIGFDQTNSRNHGQRFKIKPSTFIPNANVGFARRNFGGAEELHISKDEMTNIVDNMNQIKQAKQNTSTHQNNTNQENGSGSTKNRNGSSTHLNSNHSSRSVSIESGIQAGATSSGSNSSRVYLCPPSNSVASQSYSDERQRNMRGFDYMRDQLGNTIRPVDLSRFNMNSNSMTRSKGSGSKHEASSSSSDNGSQSHGGRSTNKEPNTFVASDYLYD